MSHTEKQVLSLTSLTCLRHADQAAVFDGCEKDNFY